jgi:hypothetical protein
MAMQALREKRIMKINHLLLEPLWKCRKLVPSTARFMGTALARRVELDMGILSGPHPPRCPSNDVHSGGVGKKGSGSPT